MRNNCAKKCIRLVNFNTPMQRSSKQVNSSVERSYYDNPDHWVPQRFNELEHTRAQLTIEWIPDNVTSILDTGCGNGIITNLLQKNFFTIGLDRSLAALHWVQAPRCQADASLLPFKNNAFDLVISAEVIEHLPVTIYKKALIEIGRVAQHYILLTVPYCEDLDLAQIICPVCGCHFNRNYHMRSFQFADLENLFPTKMNIELVQITGIGTNTIRSFSKVWKYYRSIRRKTLNLASIFPKTARCPQCQYTPSISVFNTTAPSVKKSSAIKRYLRFLQWPKKQTSMWWLALYKKRS